MNSKKLLLSVVFSITTLNASDQKHTFNDEFNNVPFTETARGHNQSTQHNNAAAQTTTNNAFTGTSSSSLLRNLRSEDGYAFNTTSSPGANGHTTGNPFITMPPLALFTTANNTVNSGFNPTVSPGANGHTTGNPFETWALSLSKTTNNPVNSGFNPTFSPGANQQAATNPFAETAESMNREQTMIHAKSDNGSEPEHSSTTNGTPDYPVEKVISRESSTDGNQDNRLISQNTHNGRPAGSNATETDNTLMRVVSSETVLSDTSDFPGHKLGNCVQSNQSESNLCNNDAQVSAAPANSPNAKDK